MLVSYLLQFSFLCESCMGAAVEAKFKPRWMLIKLLSSSPHIPVIS